ncbi:hypothetical protein AM588_10008910 [Phytophthora nicotianae]|nr:hypothetical protein AM588_10008910 [Phytophthora nicotianae]
MLRRLAYVATTMATLSVNAAYATTFSTLGGDNGTNTVAQVAPSDDVSQYDQSSSPPTSINSNSSTTEQGQIQQNASGSASSQQNSTHIQYSIRNGNVSSVG